MTQEKLYRCCNTCKYNVDKAINRNGCTIANKRYNGFSAYEPNEKVAAIETALKNLGYNPSQFTAKALDDNRHEIFLDGEYFGIFDTQRQTFAD